MNHLIGHKNTKIQKYKNNNHKKGGQIQREVYVRADMCCVERQKKGRRWPTSMAALIDAKRLFDTLEERKKKKTNALAFAKTNEFELFRQKM